MNHTSRSVVTATRKRKDRGEIENSSFYKGSFGNSHHKPLLSGNSNNASTTSSTSTLSKTVEPGLNSSNPVSSNRLLAGYMAHEFLTKGTLFGQKFDPARAEALPVSAAEQKRKPTQTGFEPGLKPNRSYADVAQLLKGDGAHIPGIVNPTQLARWIQM
ncbi:Ceramide glucosyltransferase 3 [Bienertia sinuspersici]